MPPSGSKYYAVARGKKVGVFTSWDECKAQVSHFSNASYKKFATLQEAEEFVQAETNILNYSPSSRVTNRKRHYCQADSLQVDSSGFSHVYTDGACSLNGRSGAFSGIGVYWGPQHPWNVSEPTSGSRRTNNAAEIEAVTRAITDAIRQGIKRLQINTDSDFTIKCCQDWMPRWKLNNWTSVSGKEVVNKNELLKLDAALGQAADHEMSIRWKHVQAHVGEKGNEEADKLAVNGAKMCKMIDYEFKNNDFIA